MSAAEPGENGSKDGGLVAKTAGAAVICGVAWTVYKTVKPLLCKPKHTTYLIEKGDTLYSIAHRNGVTVHDLKAANGYDDDEIYAGDVMSIPK
ncbi:hypothetical protein L7F22_046482 [Adiantum nelumboides]|nr:hypothetical protein [Adiantum nelumboides]